MKLPYSSIFRAGGVGEDSEEFACGLSRAYMRFLLASQDFPHTFWEDGSRTVLSDTEQQLLESGTAALTKLRCNMIDVAIVASPVSNQFIENPSTDYPVGYSVDVENSDYAEITGLGEITINAAGFYTVDSSIRLHGALTTLSYFRHFLTLLVNGERYTLDDHEASGTWDTLNVFVGLKLAVGDVLNFEYRRAGPVGDVWLSSGETRLRMWILDA